MFPLLFLSLIRKTTGSAYSNTAYVSRDHPDTIVIGIPRKSGTFYHLSYELLSCNYDLGDQSRLILRLNKKVNFIWKGHN